MYSMHESWHENANIVCMKIYQLPVSKPDDVIWKYSYRYNTVKKINIWIQYTWGCHIYQQNECVTSYMVVLSQQGFCVLPIDCFA